MPDIRPILFACLIYSGIQFLPLSLPQLILAEELALHPANSIIDSAHQDLLKEDASLNDVGFASKGVIWAIGNHGVVLKSDERSVKFQPLSIRNNVHWRCISIVNAKIIWLAGYIFDQNSLAPKCCVMSTVDGGKTWEEVPGCSSGALPIHLMVNSAGEGYLITTAFGETGGGYWRLNSDGWQRETNLGKHPWRTATFFSPELGILAGREGSYAILSEGKLHPDGIKRFGKIDLDCLTSNSIGHLFAGGAEELLMKSVNGGKSWVQVHEQYPQNKSISDIQSVAAMNSQLIWKVGSPGTMVSRSSDAGKTWTNYASGVSTTLRKITFLDEQHGVAVGDLGVIIVTHDGGLSWECVRHADLKTAMLCFTSSTAEIPTSCLIKKSRDEGFRISLHGVMHHDLSSQPLYADEDLRLELAGVECGVVATSLEHVFPLDRPEISVNGKLLYQRWGQLFDQRDHTILNRLVARIRQERPLAILLDSPPEGDTESAIFLLNRIIKQAIQSAKNPVYPDESIIEADLLPWEVKNVYEVLPRGIPGHIQISNLDYLPREEKYVGLLSEPIKRFCTYPDINNRDDYAFRVETMAGLQDSKNAMVQELLPGYAISPGSDMRRNVSLHIEQNPQIEERTKKIKQTYAISHQFTTDPVKGAQLLGELDHTLKVMREQEGTAYLQRVIEDYFTYGELELGLQMLLELIRRYPDSPEARQARVRYFQLLSSDEINYLRLKVRPRTHAIQQVKADAPDTDNKLEHEKQIQDLIKKTIPANVPLGPMRDLMEKKIRDAYFQQFKAEQPVKSASNSTMNEVFKAGGIDQQELEKTRALALETALNIKRADAELFQQPEIQFPLARVLFKNYKEDLAHDLLQKMNRELTADWSAAVRTEIWHYYPAGNPAHELFDVENLQVKPHLDGHADDEAWNKATRLPMGYSSPDEIGDRQLSDKTTIKCYHDGLYLYVYAHCLWQRNVPAALKTASAREHDFNLDGMERISISIDTDRDYYTAFQLEIGTQGQTRDSCAGLLHWNPQWYVASTMDEQGWQTEIAIPLHELIPAGRITGQTWNVQVMRIIPGEPLQALAHPASLPIEIKNSALFKFR